jgi:hypothetical protein
MIDIYLAGPYTAKGYQSETDLRKQLTQGARFNMLTKFAAQIMAAELLVYSPITHSHPMTLHEALPGTWAYWERMDREMLSICSELWIMKLDGWEDSEGLQDEIAIASEWRKPVVFIEPNRNYLADIIEAYKVRMVSA